MIVIQSYSLGTSSVRAANPLVKVRLACDPTRPEESLLEVEYPSASADPSARDVWCDAENRDWTGSTGITFQIKPSDTEKLSVSFFDRNRVAYTTWVVLHGSSWQPVRVRFDALRPNPHFQPPDAKAGSLLDVSDVCGIAFAPHHPGPGQLVLSPLMLFTSE